MTLQKLASEIAKIEGKKSQVRIGDIREILGILSELFYADLLMRPIGTTGIITALLENGESRLNKKIKNKKRKG